MVSEFVLKKNPFVVGNERWYFFNELFGTPSFELEEIREENDKEYRLSNMTANSCSRRMGAIDAILRTYKEMNKEREGK